MENTKIKKNKAIIFVSLILFGMSIMCACQNDGDIQTSATNAKAGRASTTDSATWIAESTQEEATETERGIIQNKNSVLNIKELRLLREELKNRNRRIIFNNDGWDAFPKAELSVQDQIKYFLSKRFNNSATTVGIPGTNIVSVFYCGTATGTFASHISRVNGASVYPGSMAALEDVELEPLNILSDWRRDNNIELFFSMRMNDTHDGISDRNFSRLASRFKKDNRQLLVGEVTDRPIMGRNWSAFDYSHREVRQFVFDILEDVCIRYDIDGIELDFVRTPPFFKSFYGGGRASESEKEAMTQLVRDTRKMSETVGLLKNKPILIAVRVTSSQSLNDSMGLEATRWAEEGLIDIITVGGDLQFDHFTNIASYWKKHGMPLYFCLANTWLKQDLRQSIEGYRARALQAWAAGADGIYLFNFFPKTVPYNEMLYEKAFNELGDRQALESSNKIYYPNYENLYNWLYYKNLPNTSVYTYYFGDNAIEFLCKGIPTFSQSWPLIMEEGNAAISFEVYIADKLDYVAEISIKIKITGITDIEDVSVTVNGTALKNGNIASGWLTYQIEAKNILRNEINKINIQKMVDRTLNLEDARIEIIY